MELRGKVALVTGAGSGIGAASALLLAGPVLAQEKPVAEPPVLDEKATRSFIDRLEKSCYVQDALKRN